jgi:hypothetical protein
MGRGPIEQAVADWHAFLHGDLEGGLDALLHEDCVFLSPIVFTPQVGREVTKRYLTAAAATFPGDPSAAPASAGTPGGGGSSFHYVKQILDGHHAVLEFETTIQGMYVNGVDLLTCDDDGKVVEFKVLIRPLKAVNLIHAQMQAMLERLAGN